MQIQFDPAKDAANRAKHGVFLEDAAQMDWETAFVWTDHRFDYDEVRMSGWGYIGLRLFHVAFVDRGDVRRIISLRKANRSEENAMPALKPGHIFVTDEEDAAITAAAASDPDCPVLTDEEWERVKPFARVGVRPVGRPPVETPRPKVTVRMDPAVLAHLRASGKGWQTRMNAVLREAVAAGKV